MCAAVEFVNRGPTFLRQDKSGKKGGRWTSKHNRMLNRGYSPPQLLDLQMPTQRLRLYAAN